VGVPAAGGGGVLTSEEAESRLFCAHLFFAVRDRLDKLLKNDATTYEGISKFFGVKLENPGGAF
jgi:hypothetical protein